VVTVSIGVVLGIVAVGSGCRLVNRHSAVPQQQLAEARRLSNEGLSAADQQDLAGAETLLSLAVKRCPTDIDARRHYASVLWQRGERMEAVEQINEALRLAPEDVPLCLAGGRMTMELGLLDDADRLAIAALHAAPQSADAWHLRGQVSLARGQDETALAEFHHGLAIAPDDRGLLLDTAEVYRRLSEIAPAHGWAPLPAERTFNRRVQEVPLATRVYHREGRDALARLIPRQRRDVTVYGPGALGSGTPTSSSTARGLYAST
jgi:tetratricopeptide (TPR) repeat protein